MPPHHSPREMRGLLLKAARSGSQHQSGWVVVVGGLGGDRGGWYDSSGLLLQYKSTESQVRSAINGYFSVFKIRG